MTAWWQRLGLHYPQEVDALYSQEEQEQIELIWEYEAAAVRKRAAEAAEAGRAAQRRMTNG